MKRLLLVFAVVLFLCPAANATTLFSTDLFSAGRTAGEILNAVDYEFQYIDCANNKIVTLFEGTATPDVIGNAYTIDSGLLFETACTLLTNGVGDFMDFLVDNAYSEYGGCPPFIDPDLSGCIISSISLTITKIYEWGDMDDGARGAYATLTIDGCAVPEPSTLLLLSIGSFSFVALLKNKKLSLRP